MSVSLVKGQKVDLTKSNPNLNSLVIGLGWDAAKKGLSIDCDASAFLLGDKDKLLNKKDIIYYGNKTDRFGAVNHSGDNLTGAGDGDDEQIIVQLDKIPTEVTKIVFTVNIYNCESKGQDFGMIQNAYIRVFDKATGKELVKYPLTESYAGYTALIVGAVYRKDSEWKFQAIGEGTKDVSISNISRRFT